MRKAVIGGSILILAMLNSYVLGAVEAPEPRSLSEVKAVLAKAPKPLAEKKLRNLNVVLVAFKKDHGPNEHDYPLWQKRWKVLLGGKEAGQGGESQVNLYGPAPKGRKKKILAGAPKVHVTTAYGWPSKEQFKTADLIAMFCYGRRNEEELGQLEEFLARGGGFVAIHPAVIPNKGVARKWAGLIGLAWEDGYTRWRHGPMDLKITAAEHPICLGLPSTIHLLDEAYWPLRGELSKVTVLAT